MRHIFSLFLLVAMSATCSAQSGGTIRIDPFEAQQYTPVGYEHGWGYRCQPTLYRETFRGYDRWSGQTLYYRTQYRWATSCEPVYSGYRRW